MNDDRETPLAALFAALQASIVFSFVANAATSSPILTAATGQVASLFTGLPVFGPGIARNTYVNAFDPIAQTVTLSQNPTIAGTGVSFKTGFLYSSRRLKFWTEQKEQPALFLRHTEDDDEYRATMALSQTEMSAEIWIYSQAGSDPDAAPDTTLNNLCRCVRGVFKPDNPSTRTYTIGGAALWCRIEGKSRYEPGDIGKQSIALLPVRILLP